MEVPETLHDLPPGCFLGMKGEEATDRFEQVSEERAQRSPEKL